METQDLFRSNLALIERLVRFVCQRARVVGADVDDFDSAVKLALIENDYAVLRAWEGRAALSTYLTVVIQRLLFDERARTLGRWRPSAEAKRLGEDGVLLEALLRRDERSMAEAVEIVRAHDASLSPADVEALAARLPERAPRLRAVEMMPVAEDIAAPDRADANVMSAETLRLSDRASGIIRSTLETLPVKDRMLVRMRFRKTMSIADIARILQVPQRPLYRRLEQILAMLRRALTEAGIDAKTAGDLIGSAFAALDFGLSSGKNEAARQSHEERGQA